MSDLLNLEPWWRFGAALLIGALIGLEREHVQQREGFQEFGGIRTFSLMSLLGAAAAYFSETQGATIFMAAYLGVILLVWAGYLSEAWRGEEEGITTEVAALMMPLLGAMMVWGRAEVGAALGVIVALILSLKPTLHSLARRMSAGDLRATLEFALISAVILPLLPNRGFGPFGILNPFQIWLLVVFVSGIGFLGYILMKLLGAERGIGLTGVLGGLVSSTATTISFATRSRQASHLSALLARGVLLASSIMFPRVAVEVAVINPSLLPNVALPLGAMLITALIVVSILWRQGRRAKETDPQEAVELSNPLRISAAVTFGLIFALVLVAVRAANEYFGSAGVYVASLLTGLTDVDSITLSVSELALNGELDSQVASISIVLASIVNTLAKAGLAASFGSPALRRTLLTGFGLVVLAGIGTGLTLIL
jgi:uncharacterized membrane protein (DUF4010 family)